MSQLYLSKPRGDNKHRLWFKSEDPKKVSEFKVACFMKMDIVKVQPIHHTDSKDFQVFEFWNGTFDEIVTECQKVARILNIELI
jgi:hypothetical protein